MNLDLRPDFELGSAAEGFAQNLFLDFELMFVGGVLVMAASAAREIRTGGRDAMGRSLDNRFGVRASESGLLLSDRSFDSFPRQNERQKNRLAAATLVGGKVGKAVAAVNHFFDGEKQTLILADACESPTSRRA